jgi:hypothetical protein
MLSKRNKTRVSIIAAVVPQPGVRRQSPAMVLESIDNPIDVRQHTSSLLLKCKIDGALADARLDAMSSTVIFR